MVFFLRRGGTTLLALLVSAVSTWCAHALALEASAATTAPLEPSALLLAVTEAALAAVLLRCALAAAATAVALVVSRAAGHGRRPDAGPAARAAVRLAPRLARPLVTALLTAGLLAVAGPAGATPSTPPPPLPAAAWTAGGSAPAAPAAPTAQPALPAAGWTPRSAPSADAAAPAASVDTVAAALRRGDAAGPEAVVRRGDCLWSVVRRALGPHASDARVAAEWPRWWAANRAAIGDDPDVISPGMRLHAPEAGVTR